MKLLEVFVDRGAAAFVAIAAVVRSDSGFLRQPKKTESKTILITRTGMSALHTGGRKNLTIMSW